MSLKRVFRAICVGVVAGLLLSLCGFTAQCEDVSERVLRLHILAASDSEEDQAIKLKVRDAILLEANGLLDGVMSTALAEETLKEALPTIKAAAQRVLIENGVNESVTVELCDSYFNTRHYEHITLPAGTYRALRVVIGAGKGQNWWCMVFPPMCLSSACEPQWEGILSEEQTDIVTAPTRYEVRFKLVEWYRQFMEWIR
ncbi:MAG: stage II sporulation protein R [Ruminococcaceae bacterium]|nr:stage II sporulation protein R [Oscillospiraceae bacterium]